MAIAGAYFNLGRYVECLKFSEQSLQKVPDIQFFEVFKIVCFVQLNRMQEARKMAKRYIDRHPNFTISRWSALTRSSPDPANITAMEDALREAGFPDWTMDVGNW